MNSRFPGAALACFLWSGCASDPTHELFEQALAARGGEDLARARGGHSRGESGTLFEVPYEATVDFRLPALYRRVLRFPALDLELEEQSDGTQCWNVQAGARKLLAADEARPVLDRARDELALSLVGLRDDPNFVLTREPPGEFRGRAVDTLRVDHRTGYSRLLHFDAASHDLVGMEGYAWTDAGRLYLEFVFSDHADSGGERWPTRLEVYGDGSEVRSARLTPAAGPEQAGAEK